MNYNQNTLSPANIPGRTANEKGYYVGCNGLIINGVMNPNPYATGTDNYESFEAGLDRAWRHANPNAG